MAVKAIVGVNQRLQAVEQRLVVIEDWAGKASGAPRPEVPS